MTIKEAMTAAVEQLINENGSEYEVTTSELKDKESDKERGISYII